jgi:cytoskeletal protein CcmA (bactofilin family)
MALWKETPTSAAAAAVGSPAGSPPERTSADRPASDRLQSEIVTAAAAPRRPRERQAEGVESVISGSLTIEGKIEGAGNVRMAGRFKGDVRIEGNFNIEPGAHLTGAVAAGIVVVGGELQGNIESATRVDVLDGGIIVGDVKAGSITVAAGSRMRGHVEFGWDDDKTVKVVQSLTGGGSS